MSKLTDEDMAALNWAAWQRGAADPKQITAGLPVSLALLHTWRHTYRPWNRLAEAGFLSKFNNSEQVRGERRQYWCEYSLTDAGRAALTKASSP